MGVEERAEYDRSEVLSSFNESVTRGADGRYEVGVAWIAGSSLLGSNEEQCRRRFCRLERKLAKDPTWKEGYEK